MQNRVTNNMRKFVKTSIQEIPISEVFLGKYQKMLSKKRVAAIIADYDPNRMRPIEVSLRDGKYWCWDGQHRLVAAKARGETTIPCQVHYGLTYSDEAMLFARQQENVGSITTAHKWNALKEAGDPTAIKIINKCREYGFNASTRGAGGKTIRSIKTLQRIAGTLGVNRLGDIVWLMKSAWNHEDVSTHEYIVGGIATFMEKYLITERCKADYDHNAAIIDRLHSTLSSTTARRLLQLASGRSDATNGNNRVALTVVDMYNKGLRKGNRLIRFGA